MNKNEGSIGKIGIGKSLQSAQSMGMRSCLWKDSTFRYVHKS